MDSPYQVLAERQRSRWTFRLLLGLLALIAMLAAISCGGSGGGSGPGDGVTIGISPATATVAPGGTATFTATVSGSSNQAVTWSSSAGSISSSGVFTAPATAGTVTVTATSVADSTKTASATVTVTSSAVRVTLNPSSIVVDKQSQTQFTATVTGTANTGVTWTANAGTITQTGLFTAPNEIRTVVVKATSQADPSVFATANVSVSNTGPIVTINPLGATLGTNETKQFTATVSNANDQRVTWTATGGTISSDGLYRAGHTAGTFTVTATSVEDPNSKVSVNVTINPIVITVNPNGATAVAGQQVQFTAQVSGTTNQGVTWTTSAGTITASGLLTAPSAGQTVTVTATSKADPTVSGTGTITIVDSSDFTYNFESGVPSVWNPTNRNETTPTGGRKFLGRMSGTEQASLVLSSLTSHRTLTISFDLYVIGAWTGAADSALFKVNVAGNNVFSRTFSNTTGNNQTYPDGGSNAPGTGRTEANTLGFTHDPAILYNDTVYHVQFNVDHTSSSVTIDFLANLNSTLQDKSWGIDNVRITANP